MILALTSRLLACAKAMEFFLLFIYVFFFFSFLYLVFFVFFPSNDCSNFYLIYNSRWSHTVNKTAWIERHSRVRAKICFVGKFSSNLCQKELLTQAGITSFPTTRHDLTII